jgi:hypothetical protein
MPTQKQYQYQHSSSFVVHEIKRATKCESECVSSGDTIPGKKMAVAVYVTTMSGCCYVQWVVAVCFMDYSWPRPLFQLSKTGDESVVHAQLQSIGQLFLSLSVAGRRVKSKAVAVPILGSICGSSKGFCSCAHNWFLSSPRPGRKRHVNFVTNPSLATAIHPL